MKNIPLRFLRVIYKVKEKHLKLLDFSGFIDENKLTQASFLGKFVSVPPAVGGRRERKGG